MTDNCEWCAKFVPEDLEYNCLCRKCNDTMEAETTEADNGIGNGQVCQADENYCRHGVQK